MSTALVVNIELVVIPSVQHEYSISGKFSTSATSSLNFSSTSNGSFLLGTENVVDSSQQEPTGVEHLYTLSYQYISVVGILCTVLVGLAASACTGMNRSGDVDPCYLISVSDSLLPTSAKRCICSIKSPFRKAKQKSNRENLDRQPGMEMACTNLETPFIKKTVNTASRALGMSQDLTPLSHSPEI
ncbi:sodium-dependent multivitamin transporter [Elysia marginata]|uniref:Sodium-dependent multivitamin transporter n=1 Tax=Elysia marginata TaxID=1093978 RepID=A0AAV4H960_9GAST|nr:sodium-dependent multivitamin transporter [Elysia marginata]